MTGHNIQRIILLIIGWAIIIAYFCEVKEVDQTMFYFATTWIWMALLAK